MVSSARASVSGTQDEDHAGSRLEPPGRAAEVVARHVEGSGRHIIEQMRLGERVEDGRMAAVRAGSAP